MKRASRTFISVLLCLAATVAAAGPVDEARELVRQAADAAEDGDYTTALELLDQAEAKAPTYGPAQSWLAHTYESIGENDEALKHVAALLAIDPTDAYGKAAAERLFMEPPFPRELSPATIAVSPLTFTIDECTLGDDSLTPGRYTLCYTTSLKYPEDAPKGSPLVEKTLPGATAEPQTAQFNRVVYGFRELPDAEGMRLRVIAYYPSTYLSGFDRDLSEVAQALVHLLLRYQVYAEGYLGLSPQADAEGINRIYLCTNGPPGAERVDTDLFFYRAISDDRSPFEWVRQLSHEAGHLAIPAIGGFAHPEMWGNGDVGERLFQHFLAREAAAVAGVEWPSAQAGAALNGLWPEGDLAIEDYLASSGRAPLAVWAGAGPDSEELVVGQDERAMQYYVGFVLHILASHGVEGLREVTKACTGSTVADFVYTYKQTIAKWVGENRPISINAGAYDVSATRLTRAPAPADLAPQTVSLAAGDTVAYSVFLPAATWHVSVPADGGDGDALLLSFDGGEAAEVALDADPTLIGPLNEGWYKLTLQAPPEQAPITLRGPVFESDPVE